MNEKSKLVSNIGELKLLSEKNNWKRAVEIRLLNSDINKNNWQYLNLEEHRKMFVGTPILIAYAAGKIGDGHNFDKIEEPNGETHASFMSATAERIVGYIEKDEDVRLEEHNGKKWIVAKAYIWKWYAGELVKKLELQGLQGMSVSIETLIDEMHTVGTTEVFTKYQILGTTILGDEISPAVADANIKALSAIGEKKMKELTLRVASKNSEILKSRQNNDKGAEKNMEIDKIASMFPTYAVVAVENNKAVMLSEKGEASIAALKTEEGKITAGTNSKCNANVVFTDGNCTFTLPFESVYNALNQKSTSLAQSLMKAEKQRDDALYELNKLKEAERIRRFKLVKETLKNRLKEIEACANLDMSEYENMLDDKNTAVYAEMEKNGEFCGDQCAVKDIDAYAMNKILSSSRKNTFTWNIGKNDDYGDGDALDKAVANIMK